MLRFLTYQTPPKFFKEFDIYNSATNLRSVKVISGLLLCISGVGRIISMFFRDDVVKINGYEQFSLNNWLQIVGCGIFLILSNYGLKKDLSTSYKKTIVIAFVVYFLTIAFNISYIVSQHNTKNTLFIFLVGIVATSLFFTIEIKQMKFIVAYIIGVYFAASWVADIPTEQKTINFIAGLILGTVLLSFSRYSYYFKSSHFVQIKELEEKNREILLLNNQKSEILSFVAHDLRAPLNNIDALSQLLLLENSDNNEMKMISNSALQAKNIINDLIEAVKTEQAEIRKESILLKPYISRIINKWEANTTRKIEFSQDLEDLNMHANASKLERVIDNLISNAFKFSSSDKPIKIAVSLAKNSIFIKVKDFGIGIPIDLQGHIFEQFSRASRKGLLGEKSVGLGLHISHKIIEQHRGELSMHSSENEGTTFTIQLPLMTA
ncbi:MAG: HAMP domain-containing histidine kinase [Flavobacterium sp.]|nr:MAG: HAMP domain-containing histidine kinase [Flavobacterium sp.]